MFRIILLRKKNQTNPTRIYPRISHPSVKITTNLKATEQALRIPSKKLRYPLAQASTPANPTATPPTANPPT